MWQRLRSEERGQSLGEERLVECEREWCQGHRGNDSAD